MKRTIRCSVKRAIKWNSFIAIDHVDIEMDVCKSCGVGAGVTHYPDGDYIHACDKLVNDLCPDCIKSKERREK